VNIFHAAGLLENNHLQLMI